MIAATDYQPQLRKCYQQPQIITLIASQIAELIYSPELSCDPKFALLRFQVPSRSQSYKFSTDTHSIEFCLVLGKGYPAIAPRLHILNNLTLPGINDCRNLLSEVLGIEKWEPGVTLKDVQKSIPVFLGRIGKNQSIYHIARLGSFHLQMVYPMELIKRLRKEQYYMALELRDETEVKMVLLDVSSTHLAIFTTKEQPHFQGQAEGFKIPQQTEITSCMLVFYAELGSIADISVDRLNFSDISLTFVARKPHNMNLEQLQTTKRFKIKKGLSFIQKLIKGIKYYEPLDARLTLCPDNITQHQATLLHHIKQAEQVLQHHLNVSTVRRLADCYQSAVQYYSGQSIPYYEVYLDSITRLYNRQDVRAVMGMDSQGAAKEGGRV